MGARPELWAKSVGAATGPTLLFGAAGVSPCRGVSRCGPAAVVGRGGVVHKIDILATRTFAFSS